MKRGTIVLVLLLAVACRSRSVPEPSTQWERVGPGGDSLETARAACKEEAFEKTKHITVQSSATKAAAGVFVECMRRHGWAPAEKPTR